MIQIDMQMPENCRMCPVCSEYDICLIPVDGKGFGEQNVSEFTEGRPEWCPLKEQKELVGCKDCKHRPLEPNWKTYESGFDLEFPDNECPCQCSGDGWYSWYPSDDWFCPKGEHT